MNKANNDNDCPRDTRAERYRFSANRGDAHHKVRYVESGGGKAEKTAKVCQPVLKPKHESNHDSEEQ